VLRQRRTSPVDSDYALAVVTNFLCRVTNSAHLVVGPSLSLDRRLGIRCLLTSVIRRVMTSFSDVLWKHSCSLSTSVSSALEFFSMTMRYINRYYLSIYLSIYPTFFWNTVYISVKPRIHVTANRNRRKKQIRITNELYSNRYGSQMSELH